MPLSAFVASDHYLDYTRHLRRLHRLIRRGDGDPEAADAIREEMDASWRHLTPEEAARARQMSADLNTVGSAPPAGQEGAPDEPWRRLRDAERAGDWPGILALLRDHPAILPPHEAAYVRGRCWSALGEVATAVVFFEEAVRLDPLGDRPALALIQSLHALGQFKRMDRVILSLSERGNPAIPPRWVELVHHATKAREDYLASARALRQSRRELRRLRRAAREARQALRRSREGAWRRALIQVDSSSPLP